MDTIRRYSFWNFGGLDSPLGTALLVCLVGALSYFAPKLEWASLFHPQTIWPVWPTGALLVGVLLLVPRRIWPILIPTSFASVVLFDIQTGVPAVSIVWFIAADSVQVLIAAFALSYYFDGVPRLNSVKAVSKYLLFAVILAQSVSAFLAAPGISGDYWFGWRVSFFSDALAFLTLTPAVLSWVSDGSTWLRKSVAYRLEASVANALLVVFAYVIFVRTGQNYSPALLYSLVPCLLWSALRFGTFGVSTSMIAVMFLSIWGTVHGRGPFSGLGPFEQILSLQLFLFFTAIPFMVLAALAEERKQANHELREKEERLRLAAEAGKMYAFDWDTVTDVIVRSGQCADVFNWMEDPTRDTGRQFLARIHPDDRWVYSNPDWGLTPRDPAYHIKFRLLRPDGSVVWLEARGRALFDSQGKRLRIMGMAANVTARKEAEETLQRRDAQLAEAQRITKLGSWFWDIATDTVTWSEELYRIIGRDSDLPAPSYQEHQKLFTPESWERLRHVVEEALHTAAPYELDLEMVRPDGTSRWLLARGEAQRDATGRIVQLHGTVQDITERKAVEERLRNLSGRLITAQEEERTRIARELHDDLSQQMALLQCGLEQFEQHEPAFEAPEKLHNLVEIAEHVSSNIHDLSHRLHPSRLDILGLVPSLAGFCREFSRLHQVQVHFTHQEIPENISGDLSLCLFRIAQEALRNVVKHSGAVQARVELLGIKNQLELCVVDTGIGFDPASPECRQGVGLISMRERMRLIGGGLTVEAVEPHGTRVRARAPLCAIGDSGKQEAFKAGA